MKLAVGSRTRRAASTRKKPASQSPLGKERKSASDKDNVASLNNAPINQHALKLLPKWALQPDEAQLHVLTLVAPAQFASQAQCAMLQKMRREWAPSAVLEYFSRVDGFEDLFLAQHWPLEAVEVILAAVNIIAEPQRYLPPFRLE